MNWKVYYLVFVALLVTSYSNSQSNLLNAIEVDQIGKQSKEKIAADNDTPLSYGYIDDRDILWSKVVWEFVDLNQKINLPYYYPIDTANISNDRRSLFDTLLKGIRKGDIKNVYSDSFFTSKITGSEINEKLVNIRLNGDYPDTFRIQTQDIEGYMMKGMWYFDKRLGELKYRLLALAPMGKDVLTLGLPDIEDDELYELFWVFYPETREILHKAKVFNPKNVSQPISYDHLLNARRFNSVIVREENIYGNRKIADYIRGNALFQLLEADRIKESIRDKEIDMWNY
ncbi:gliding motility protein GldN [Flavobacteriaceae bacterium]|jgi:gliding motility associated protien GldN|nr:gliding motility protein GldN [Flavobacteriaceae bacterium]MDB2632665.1 gliding motility protein GldN [Flavobacteriaceae bacterium]MDC0330948.1 gliding motility protein GldN [Flavobacteriaceae bacterium]MDC3365834.1 gliding motility protein GldN [Flavobacteriaceae bacterium]MDG2274781.1 gliding motility protein GldN [Flavobacteriaceae bacterium]|tara:strand:- start:861 stop:1718 length:858 start_codon:yes stop_codon:yes gene_type:complete